MICLNEFSTPPDCVHAFLDAYRTSQGNRYVFGRTPQASLVIQEIGADFVVDDYTHDQVFEGIPVVRRSELGPSAIIISAVMHQPMTVQRILDAGKWKHVSYYRLQNEGILPCVPFW